MFAGRAHGRAAGNTSSIFQATPNTTESVVYTAVNVSKRSAEDVRSGRTLSSSLSVVQDWNLVCKQLCGAGLGGEPCDSECGHLSLPQYVKTLVADAILNPNKYAICQDLCLLQLGGSSCDCSQVIPFRQPRTVQTRNSVCSTFCEHNGSTLAGCSVCSVRYARTVNTTPMEGNITKTEAAATTEETPDWDSLCKSLCKTGDGGALCNCDLPPLF